MHIETFDSPEEMAQAIRERQRHALAGLAPAQANLSFGDCWVQFHDLDRRHIIFGRILTLEEVALGELLGDYGDLREDVEWETVVTVIEQTKANLDNGLMYGWAHDRFNIEGELGHTHKAHVWPIEDRLFEWAKAVDFEINRLDSAGRFLLELSFRSMRAHVLPQYREQA